MIFFMGGVHGPFDQPSLLLCRHPRRSRPSPFKSKSRVKVGVRVCGRTFFTGMEIEFSVNLALIMDFAGSVV